MAAPPEATAESIGLIGLVQPPPTQQPLVAGYEATLRWWYNLRMTARWTGALLTRTMARLHAAEFKRAWAADGETDCRAPLLALDLWIRAGRLAATWPAAKQDLGLVRGMVECAVVSRGRMFGALEKARETGQDRGLVRAVRQYTSSAIYCRLRTSMFLALDAVEAVVAAAYQSADDAPTKTAWVWIWRALLVVHPAHIEEQGDRYTSRMRRWRALRSRRPAGVGGLPELIRQMLDNAATLGHTSIARVKTMARQSKLSIY